MTPQQRQTQAVASATRTIEYLSPPMAVRMANRWYEISSIDHFWVWRRFAVLERLTRGMFENAGEMAEIGCGHGLLQRQIEDAWGREVMGIDLNETALKQNVSRLSRVCCYDILKMTPDLRERFDVIFLFDVLEHIVDEAGFLKALRFHLALEGRLVINVPAGQWLFSQYDVADGHVRRYSIGKLREAAARGGFLIRKWSYWGMPLVPALVLRKLLLRGEQDPDQAIEKGFSVGPKAINQMMKLLSQCEIIPQRVLGTSLMAVLQIGGLETA